MHFLQLAQRFETVLVLRALEHDQRARFAQGDDRVLVGLDFESGLDRGELFHVLALANRLDGLDTFRRKCGAEIDEIQHGLHRAAQIRVVIDRLEIAFVESQRRTGRIRQRLAIDHAHGGMSAHGIRRADQTNGNARVVRRRVNEQGILPPRDEQLADLFVGPADERAQDRALGGGVLGEDRTRERLPRCFILSGEGVAEGKRTSESAEQTEQEFHRARRGLLELCQTRGMTRVSSLDGGEAEKRSGAGF